MGGDIDPEMSSSGKPGYLLGCKVDDLRQLFYGVEAVRKLPPPVIPLSGRHIRPGMGSPPVTGRLFDLVLLRIHVHGVSFLRDVPASSRHRRGTVFF
jgi:hypothetical protein